jgi:tRNA-dihydrouridine synthase B
MNSFWQKLKKPIIALAPMAGITDSAFRQRCKKWGADLVYSEMVSADGLKYGGEKTFKLMQFEPKEKPILIQLFGKNPANFGRAARMVEASGADGVDLNFGCPASKVVASGGGAALMQDLNLAHQIIESTLKNTKLPVSVKIRTSMKDVTALDFLKKIENLKIAAVMVHGRSYAQGFSGAIDFATIKDIKKVFKGLVLANGGINTPEDAKEVLEKTGADGLGIARGAWGKPWIFKQIKEFLETDKYQDLTWDQKKEEILEHARLQFKLKADWGLVELRKHLAWYVRAQPGASQLRAQLDQIKTLREIEQKLHKNSPTINGGLC